MADYKTTLVVGADTTQAEEKLDKLKRKADGTGGDGTPPAPPPPGGDRDPRRQGEEFGRAAYKQIGRAVAGFALHQVAGIAFAAARTPGGNNVNVDRAEAGVGGALQYGTMGAMLGGPLGAAIGGLAGAVAGLARHEMELRKQVAENVMARQDTVYRANVSSTTRASDAAFAELTRGRTTEERIAMLEARRQEIRSGEGQWSIANLEASIRRREAAGDIKSHEYQAETANLEMQRQRETALSDMIIAARMDARAPEAVTAGDFSDAYSKRGLQIGGDAATAAMDEQLAIGREQVQLLRRIADMGTSSIYKSAAVERVAATFE